MLVIIFLLDYAVRARGAHTAQLSKKMMKAFQKKDTYTSLALLDRGIQKKNINKPRGFVTPVKVIAVSNIL